MINQELPDLPIIPDVGNHIPPSEKSVVPVTNPQAHLGFVSTSQAAIALGVSVSTIKRWVDEGVLPAHKTSGKHRKLLVSDLLRLIREGKLPNADLVPLLGSGPANMFDSQSFLEQLLAANQARDTKLIGQIIDAAYRGGMPVETIGDQLIAPLMRKIGHDWEQGDVNVVHEHRATQACLSAIYEMEKFIRGVDEPSKPLALGGAPEFDHYQLASQLVKLTLLDNGWEAINLGPHTPFSAFRAALHEFKPQLIWLSATQIVDPDRFIADFNSFFQEADEMGVAVAVGGQALGLDLRKRLRYSSFGDGLTHLASFARTLHRRPIPYRSRKVE